MAMLGLVCAGVLGSALAVAEDETAPAAGPGRGPGHRAHFQAADTDGDGALSLAEFQAMHAKRLEHMKERLGDRYDAAKAANRPSAEDIFKKMDTDGNGLVTPEEMAAARPKAGERRGGGPGGRRHGGTNPEPPVVEAQPDAGAEE
jgi:hypothetical protein